MNNIKTYSELCSLNSFEERFRYLKLNGIVGKETFGRNRYLNQYLYQRSVKWKSARDIVIIRDNACDLGLTGYEVVGQLIVHHINPVTIEDIEDDNDCLYDPNNLICTSFRTHNAIHYGDAKLLSLDFKERRQGDTKLW